MTKAKVMARLAGSILLTGLVLGLLGCETKLHCDVRATTEKVADEERTVFVVVNRGANDIRQATLIVEGELAPEDGSAAVSGPFQAKVREVLAGKEKKIGLSLLQTQAKKKVEGKLTVKSVRLEHGEGTEGGPKKICGTGP